MNVDDAGDMQVPTAQQPQQTETSKDVMPEQGTKTGVKVKKVLCGGALKVRTLRTPTSHCQPEACSH